jgi:hypothetical protein
MGNCDGPIRTPLRGYRKAFGLADRNTLELMPLILSALARKPIRAESTTAGSSGYTFIKKSFLVLLLPIRLGHFLGLAQRLERLVHEFLQLDELSGVR